MCALLDSTTFSSLEAAMPGLSLGNNRSNNMDESVTRRINPSSCAMSISLRASAPGSRTIHNDFEAQQQLERLTHYKRKRPVIAPQQHLVEESCRRHILDESSSLSTNGYMAPYEVMCEEDGSSDKKRVKSTIATEKKAVFELWLELKELGIVSSETEQLAIELRVAPEDLYEHFHDFADHTDLSVFDKQLRYERSAAERALNAADVGAWLLRRSSYNRRWTGKLKSAYPIDDGVLDLGGAAPQFFAFSYNKPAVANVTADGRKVHAIGHLLIVSLQWHGWALAESEAGGVIRCHQFFGSFVALLGFIIDSVGISPTRRLGYDAVFH